MTSILDVIKKANEAQKFWIEPLYGELNIPLDTIERALPYLDDGFRYSLNQWLEKKRTGKIKHSRPYFEAALKAYANKIWEKRQEHRDKFNALPEDEKARLLGENEEQQKIRREYERRKNNR